MDAGVLGIWIYTCYSSMSIEKDNRNVADDGIEINQISED